MIQAFTALLQSTIAVCVSR